MQAWGFANIGYEPGEDFWQQVGQNAIYHIHDYSAQNIANGESGRLILRNPPLWCSLAYQYHVFWTQVQVLLLL